MCAGGGLLMVYKIAIGQWFLNAYVVVMCFAPILNLAIERMTIKELYPLVLLVFGWSFATTLPISGLIPLSSGVTAYSFLTLLGVYVVARFVKRLHNERGRFFEIVSNKMVMLLILGVCLVMVAIGLGDYNSPFAVAVAASVFFLFKNCNISTWLGKVCAWLAPSMFSVYLIHSHGYAWGYFKMIEDYLLANFVSMSIVYVLTALIIFIVCLLADLPRRWILRFYRKHHD
jgi:surface polysaccharide O-acyltransferase-like enzyme